MAICAELGEKNREIYLLKRQMALMQIQLKGSQSRTDMSGIDKISVTVQGHATDKTTATVHAHAKDKTAATVQGHVTDKTTATVQGYAAEQVHQIRASSAPMHVRNAHAGLVYTHDPDSGLAAATVPDRFSRAASTCGSGRASRDSSMDSVRPASDLSDFSTVANAERVSEKCSSQGFDYLFYLTQCVVILCTVRLSCKYFYCTCFRRLAF